MKCPKRIVTSLAKDSKRKVENWMRRLMVEIRNTKAEEGEKAEKLLRLMQSLSEVCNYLDGQWAEIVRGEEG